MHEGGITSSSLDGHLCIPKGERADRQTEAQKRRGIRGARRFWGARLLVFSWMPRGRATSYAPFPYARKWDITCRQPGVPGGF